MATGERTLIHPVRLPTVAKHLGQLCLSLAVVALVPALVAVVDGEHGFAVRAGVVAAVLAAFGGVLSRRHAPRDLQPNEAMTILALAFITMAAAMAWPFAAFGLSPLDALFESVSSVTTTGLTMLADPKAQPASMLFARAWVQWCGGLLIVVLALALFVPPGTVAKRIAESETGDGDIVGGTRLRARRMLAMYAGLTLVGIAALAASGLGWFDAVVHGLAALSTGGFATSAGSIGDFGWAVRVIASLLGLAGAIAFSVYYRAWTKGPGELLRDAQVRGLLAACVIVAAVLALTMATVGGRSWAEALAVAPLLSFSAQTTTGFEAAPVSALDPASKLVLIASMLVGGDVGSTAGGIKIIRLLLLIRLVDLCMRRTALPRHAVSSLTVGGRRAEPGEVEVVVAMVVAFVGVIAVSWLVFVIHGFAPLDALFEVVSATGTVGMSAGITDPAMPAVLKGVLCADMLMGRLEIVGVLVLLYPWTWIARRAG